MPTFIEKQLSALASDFQSLPITDALHPPLLKFATAVLVAGDLALWMGPGRKMIEHSWQSSKFGIKLCGSLADLDWGGWKMIALASVSKMAPQLLENDPVGAVSLLAALHRKDKLGDLDPLSRERLQAWICTRLTKWEKNEDSVGIYLLFHF
jgi:U3 small nucleolar RNA-associated protein 20